MGIRPAFLERLLAGKKQTIVAYGTSLTAMGEWPDIFASFLDKRFPGLAKVVNSAQNGQWSKWGVDNLDDRVLKHNPDVVFIEFAINDAYIPYETSLDDVRRNLECMIDRILGRNPECNIIIMTMSPPTKNHLDDRIAVEKYIELYRQVASERGIVLVDQYPIWERLLREDRAMFDKYMPDGLHPNRLGSEKITVSRILETLGFSARDAE